MGRKLAKHQIGEGFFDDLVAKAKTGIHAHVDALAKKHGAHVKAHVGKAATQLFKAKGKKAELTRIKNALVKEGVAKAHALTEVAQKKGHAHVEKLKKAAVARVRSKVCGTVGAGFFDGLIGKVTGFVKKAFGIAKKTGAAAVKQGVAHVKQKVAQAPGIIKAHLKEHKDEYIEAAKKGLIDVAQNGKEGVHNQLEKLKGHMVKKTRSAAGCETAGSLELSGAGFKTLAGKVKRDPDMRRKVRANLAAMRAGKRQPYGSADDISLVGSGMRVVRGRR